jgi:biopolymer transport protein ExbB
VLIVLACALGATLARAQDPAAPTGVAPTGERIELGGLIGDTDEAVKQAMEEGGTGDNKEFVIPVDPETDITNVKAGDMYAGGDKTTFTVASTSPNGKTGGKIVFKRTSGKTDPDMGFKFKRIQGLGPELIAKQTRLIEFYHAAGWPAHIILVLAIGSVLLTANSLWLYRRRRQCPARFVTEGERLLDKGDIEGLEDLALKNGGLFPHICRALVERFDSSTEADIRTRVEIVAGAQVTRLRVPIKLLNFLAVCAPLVGLAGTIYGMMIVFEGIAGASEASRATLLAAGIRLKLLCTLFALMVAIPSLFCFYVFNSRLGAIVAECELLAERFMHKVMIIKRRQSIDSVPSANGGDRMASAAGTVS